jgi:hypothetical protein
MKLERITWFFVALFVTASVAHAQTTSTGTLTVSANIVSSIELTFETAGGGVALGGSGSNAATLDFGEVSAFGSISTAGVIRTVGASSYTVSSPFNVRVTKANASSSSSFALSAALDATDAYTWRVNSTNLTNVSQSVGTSLPYDTATSQTFSLIVPFAAAAASPTRVVTFTAVAD